MLKQVITAASPQQVWERLLRSEPISFWMCATATSLNAGGWKVRILFPRSIFPILSCLTWKGEEEDVTAAVMRGVQAQLMEQLPRDRPAVSLLINIQTPWASLSTIGGLKNTFGTANLFWRIKRLETGNE